MIDGLASMQSAAAVLMVRPRHFMLNSETAVDNELQCPIPLGGFPYDISLAATHEFDGAVRELRNAGVIVHVFEDGEIQTPDSVFPNNWISTHGDGRVVLYPLRSRRRRPERRLDVVETLQRLYSVTAVVDYSPHEARNKFLEGTGALVLDHVSRTAFVTVSRRADRELIELFCSDFDFDAVIFEAVLASGAPVYHTNVMMCIASEFALVAMDLIKDAKTRHSIRERLIASGRRIVELTPLQVAAFVGNALEVRAGRGNVLVLSTTALRHLRRDQIEQVESSVRLLPLHLPTIELSGGSARCMMVGVHLATRRSAKMPPVLEFGEAR